MQNVLLGVSLVIGLASLCIGLLVWFRVRRPVGANLDQALRDELRVSRDEAAAQSRSLREEVASAQAKALESLVKTIDTMGDNQRESLARLTQSINESAVATRADIEKLVQRTTEALKEIQSTTETRLESVRKSTEDKLQAGQEAADRRGAEMLQQIQALTEAGRQDMAGQRDKLDVQLKGIQKETSERLDGVRLAVEDKLGKSTEAQRAGLDGFGVKVNELIAATKAEHATQRERMQAQMLEIQKSQEDRADRVRLTLDEKLRQIQESNEKKLEEMRQTVDEKLHKTLETRLGESFKLVSDRLAAVQDGLSDMKSLATGVGDLKRVLTNVKDRGTWGEYQLEAILVDLLTPDQFERNVQPKEGGERVEFALKLPGKGGDDGKPVWLPIDAKFPKEDYERLVLAADKADAEAVKAATKALADEIRRCARDIHDKYISPPSTTDFAVLFLPTEGLYAEVLRQPGLHDELQRKYRVLAAGPTTLAAILNSLRMGFQTLAIEKRASEVWNVLSAVKTEFGKFGEVLDKVKKQLHSAATTIDKTTVRTRAMERKLRDVHELPSGHAEEILGLPVGADVLVAEEGEEVPEPVADDADEK